MDIIEENCVCVSDRDVVKRNEWKTERAPGAEIIICWIKCNVLCVNGGG